MLSSATYTTLTEKHDPNPIGPSVCMYIVLVYMLMSFSHSHTVCALLSTGPGCSPLGRPLLLLLLDPYPPFDVSHIPFPAALIVFCNYFHPSAIVTGSGCTTLNKLVQEMQRADSRSRNILGTSVLLLKNKYNGGKEALKNYVGA